ncbi:MAG: riboflavin synthase [Chitinophagales bacterium]|nr:riboflavin synthase [Chitinophagales bacterium]MDW8393709.1 riboflavin synthase [Chitinophagales bacterium]
MFTGIVECVGRIADLQREGSSIRFRVTSPLAEKLQTGQSLLHDGVCLTVERTGTDWHEVVAVNETLKRSTLGLKGAGSGINLERALSIQGLLEGHLVQGHVDTVARCLSIREDDGSWEITFGIPRKKFAPLVVPKGSVCIDGVSLTVCSCTSKKFSVVIVPYTYEHTTFQWLKEGGWVNVEFDVVGKYLKRFAEKYGRKRK